MDDPIEVLGAVLQWAKFGRLTSGRLAGVRHARESDEQTLERVLEKARKVICPHCSGWGRSMDSPCRHCHGTGERAYDPYMPIVREVMRS